MNSQLTPTTGAAARAQLLAKFKRGPVAVKESNS